MITRNVSIGAGSASDRSRDAVQAFAYARPQLVPCVRSGAGQLAVVRKPSISRANRSLALPALMRAVIQSPIANRQSTIRAFGRLDVCTFGRFSRAVTLLEVMLAMSMLVLLSSLTYWFYFSSLKSREEEMENDRKLQLARTVLNRMAAEIRQSSSTSKNGQVGIRGEEEQIWLTTMTTANRGRNDWFAPTDEPRPVQFDVSHVNYKIARHPELVDDDGFEEALGLARVEVRVPRAVAPVPPETAEKNEGEQDETGELPEDEGVPPEEEEVPQSETPVEPQFDIEELLEEEEDGEPTLGPDINWEELYAPELHYLRFCYYDGFKWWDKWDLPGGENPLPQLVMITIGFQGRPPFGEGLGLTPNEEYCECMNRDPVDCERLEPDLLSMVVRVPQADPFFRSRVTRETQALVEGLSGGEGEEEEAPK